MKNVFGMAVGVRVQSFGIFLKSFVSLMVFGSGFVTFLKKVSHSVFGRICLMRVS